MVSTWNYFSEKYIHIATVLKNNWFIKPLKRAGSVLSGSEFDPILYLWLNGT